MEPEVSDPMGSWAAPLTEMREERPLLALGHLAGKGKAKSRTHPGNLTYLTVLHRILLEVSAHPTTHTQQPPLSLCMPGHLQQPAWENEASVKSQQHKREKTEIGKGIPGRSFDGGWPSVYLIG